MVYLHLKTCINVIPFLDSVDPFTITASPTQPRYVLNDRGKHTHRKLKLCHTYKYAYCRHMLYIPLFLTVSCSLSLGPLFFLSCFGVAVGMALLYYYGGKYNKYLPFFSFFPQRKKPEVIMSYGFSVLLNGFF